MSISNYDSIISTDYFAEMDLPYRRHLRNNAKRGSDVIGTWCENIHTTAKGLDQADGFYLISKMLVSPPIIDAMPTDEFVAGTKKLLEAALSADADEESRQTGFRILKHTVNDTNVQSRIGPTGIIDLVRHAVPLAIACEKNETRLFAYQKLNEIVDTAKSQPAVWSDQQTDTLITAVHQVQMHEWDVPTIFKMQEIDVTAKRPQRDKTVSSPILSGPSVKPTP